MSPVNLPKVVVPTQQKSPHKPVTKELTQEIDGLGVLSHRYMSAVVYGKVFPATSELERRKVKTKALVVVHADDNEDWVQERMDECRIYQLSKKDQPQCAVYFVKHPSSVPGCFESISVRDTAHLREFLNNPSSCKIPVLL